VTGCAKRQALAKAQLLGEKLSQIENETDEPLSYKKLLGSGAITQDK